VRAPRVPSSKRNATDYSHSPQSASSEPHHAGGNSGFVKKHQPGGVKQALLPDPTSASSGYICSLSLGSLQAFSKGEVAPVKKARERAAAGSNAMLSELCDSFFQGQVRLVGKSPPALVPPDFPVAKHFPRAASARRSCSHSSAAST
jgi:hypothetical protein